MINRERWAISALEALQQVFERLRSLASARRLDIKAATRGYTSTEVVEHAERYGTTMDGATPDHLLPPA
jgi:hypothetical protein